MQFNSNQFTGTTMLLRTILALLALGPLFKAFAQEPVRPAQTYICAYAPLKDEDGYNACLNAQAFSFGVSKNASRSVIISDSIVKLVLSKILEPIGLKPDNFRMISCENISNCIAWTSPAGMRYILYDPNFLATLSDQTKTNWPYYSILAHEAAHHLNHHLYLKKDSAERRQMELEADEWSGHVMALMGATLADAQSVTMQLPNEPNFDETKSSHPAFDKRLHAIRQGYEKAARFKTAEQVKNTIHHEDLVNHAIQKAESLPGMQSLREKKYFLQQAVYSEQQWWLFFRREKQDYEENFYISDTLPHYQLAQYTFTTWNISALEHLNGKWFIGMSKKRKPTEQEIVFGAIDVAQINQNNLAEDSTQKILTEFSSNGKDWVTLYDNPAKYHVADQKIVISTNFPGDSIESKMSAGYRVAKLKHLQGKWYVLLNKYNYEKLPEFKQVIFEGTDDKFPMEKFVNYDNMDYYLEAAGSNGKKWVVIMNKTLIK